MKYAFNHIDKILRKVTRIKRILVMRALGEHITLRQCFLYFMNDFLRRVDDAQILIHPLNVVANQRIVRASQHQSVDPVFEDEIIQIIADGHIHDVVLDDALFNKWDKSGTCC